MGWVYAVPAALGQPGGFCVSGARGRQAGRQAGKQAEQQMALGIRKDMGSHHLCSAGT